jgi:hypothetical protein
MRNGSSQRRLDRLESQVSSLRRLRPAPRERPWFSELLAVAAAEQRPAVEAAARAFPERGYGLSSWATNLREGGRVPAGIPAEVIAVYLTDDEALPLQDCEACGLLVPVRPGRHYGTLVEPPRQYFDACPACGGRVGYSAYWDKHGKKPGGADDLPGQPCGVSRCGGSWTKSTWVRGASAHEGAGVSGD